ncbi:MAG: Methyltransferase [Candidatus Taylorbacteria bacterium]|nr:Methyltransferase [Candidatus Taylorbacteria bacterium]
MAISNSVHQFDDYAGSYEKWTRLPLRSYAWRETVLRNLPDLRNKKVLDLACGTGTSAELLFEKGARAITGIDSSAEQLKIFNSKFPDAVAICADLSSFDLAHLGNFDVITAIYLFEYFPRISDIDRIVINIKAVMRKNSIFYGLTIDQLAVASETEYYGIQGSLPKKEGDSFVDNLPDGESGIFCVGMYYWSITTLRQVFEDNGLAFEELPVFVSEEGLEKYGKEYWDLFLQKPIYKIFRARLK